MNESEVWNQHHLSQIRGLEEVIDADQAEIEKLEKIIEKASRNSLKTKSAIKEKEYADFLKSTIIPRYKQNIEEYRKIVANHEKGLSDIEPTLF